jgi:hypothetical protein
MPAITESARKPKGKTTYAIADDRKEDECTFYKLPGSSFKFRSNHILDSMKILKIEIPGKDKARTTENTNF